MSIDDQTPTCVAVAMSDSSWIVIAPTQDQLIGFVCAEADSTYSVHDADERPLGLYPTFDGAVGALHMLEGVRVVPQ